MTTRLSCATCAEHKSNTRVGSIGRDAGRLVLVTVYHVLAPPAPPATVRDPEWFVTASAEDIAAHLVATGATVPYDPETGRPVDPATGAELAERDESLRNTDHDERWRTTETRRYVDDLDPHGGPVIWDCPALRCQHEIRLTAERCRELVASGVREVRL